MTTQLPPARAMTWLNGSGLRFSLMPTAAALDCSWVISEVIHAVPFANGSCEVHRLSLT